MVGQVYVSQSKTQRAEHDEVAGEEIPVNSKQEREK
jgi:hypothetical protein